MQRPDDDEFSELVAARSHTLRRTAYLMCGDWHQAEDLTQIAFIKLHAAWGRVRRREDLDAYLRKTLLRACIDEKRHARWRREFPGSDDLPDRPAADRAPDQAAADRDLLVAALRTLPPGQRAVLVLRFWEDQSVEEAARLLGCSAGTVKSQTARGLAALRVEIASSAHTADPDLLTWKEG
ncbi:SigE family RNA polymerase sigma factor [Catenulispora sp. NF23]|uniref:SigE family RNA polymerase sigma factor n=1 Tax=Catenulispora pinistramenti TaxID=2705254 RepID=UPI001BA89226|nr:SigE family RNA polymerase sigma factor [Catenulispora pinistramenti]MBS2537617.1 SigE family RNA polymerase sigma factor [Catenulispora pinistramenti]